MQSWKGSLEFREAVRRRTKEYQTGIRDLFVAKTTLLHCHFHGLFAGRDYAKNELVCIYSGTSLRTSEALRLQDKSYLMRLGEQCYVDAKHHLDTLARFINDCISPCGWNVVFEKRPEEQCAYVRALRDIRANEEIFVDYGKWYWAGKRPTGTLRLQDQHITLFPQTIDVKTLEMGWDSITDKKLVLMHQHLSLLFCVKFFILPGLATAAEVAMYQPHLSEEDIVRYVALRANK